MENKMSVFFVTGITGREVSLRAEYIAGIEADGRNPDTKTFIYYGYINTPGEVRKLHTITSFENLCIYCEEPYESVKAKYLAALNGD